MARTLAQLQAAIADNATGNIVQQDMPFDFLNDILYAMEFENRVNGVATPDTVADGALVISLATKTTYIDSSGAVITVTLADGYEGQRDGQRARRTQKALPQCGAAFHGNSIGRPRTPD